MTHNGCIVNQAQRAVILLVAVIVGVFLVCIPTEILSNGDPVYVWAWNLNRYYGQIYWLKMAMPILATLIIGVAVIYFFRDDKKIDTESGKR